MSQAHFYEVQLGSQVLFLGIFLIQKNMKELNKFDDSYFLFVLGYMLGFWLLLFDLYGFYVGQNMA